MIDWYSKKSEYFLNLKFPQEQAAFYRTGIEPYLERFPGHFFLLTSGTTAQAKWVALAKTAFLEAAQASNQHLKCDSSDVWLNPLPGFHAGGMSIWARAELSRSRVVSLSEWNVGRFVELLQSESATLTSLVPTQVFDLVNAGIRNTFSLRGILVGGGALSASLYQQARELGWPVLPTYGMTETCSQVATAVSDRSPDLVILPHLEVQMGEEGRFKIRGKSLLTAYVFADGRIEDPKKDGWFHSQDRGEVQNRVLKVFGRTSDFVKIGGESVELGRLREIWDQICLENQVKADTAIAPVPDSRLGHVIQLFTDESLLDARPWIEKFNSRVLGFEKIRKWNRLPKLPRTDLGKLIISQLES